VSELSPPLIDAAVDLRDFDFMPFFGDRLFKSDTWIMCDAEEKVAALRLWWAAWHQEPAGSLPDNDRLLADLAGYGVAVSAWTKVRPNAMRGWIECTDGRLYHPVVCEIAIDVWGKKRKKQSDNEADRARKRRKRGTLPADNIGNQENSPADIGNNSGGQTPGHPAENALKEKEKEKRKEEPPKPPEGAEGGKPKRDRKKPQTALPEDWVTPEDWCVAEQAKYPGLNVAIQNERFVNYARQKDWRMVDWRAAFRNWMSTAAERQGIAKVDPTKPAASSSPGIDDREYGARVMAMRNAGYTLTEINAMPLRTMSERDYQAKLAAKRRPPPPAGDLLDPRPTPPPPAE